MSFNNDYDSFYRPTRHQGQQESSHNVDQPLTGQVIDTPPQGGPQKRKSHRGLKVIAFALCGVLVFGGVFGLGYAAQGLVRSLRGQETNIYVSSREPVEVTPVAVDGKTEMSYTELYATNVNSCVSINVSETTNIFGQQAQVMASSGSGFIISKDGYIVTNYHVIAGSGTSGVSTDVKVTLYDGTTYDAEVIGGDEDFDIAVLKISADQELTPVVIGSSDELQVGDDIAVIGNPLGELTFSMSEGIVSTTDRLINVDGTPFNMIQITAAVNSGNSGGPLFNMYGEVVGIVSAKLSSSSSSKASVEGLGFAIPMDDVQSMITDIITNGYVTNKPYLGIYGSDFKQSYIPNSVVTEGVYVYSVEEGGAADQAGIRAGDVITKIGDEDIAGMDDITTLRKSYVSGDTVTVEFYRSNEKMTTELTFGSMPEQDETTETSNNGNTQQAPSQDQYYDPYDFFNDFFGGRYFGSSYQTAA